MAVVLLVIAGGVAAYNISASNKTALDDGGNELPSDARMIDVVCVDTGAHAKISPDLVQHFGARGGRARAAKSAAEIEPPKEFDCADCPGGKAVLAMFCAECDKFIARKKMDGTPNDCSDCWD